MQGSWFGTLPLLAASLALAAPADEVRPVGTEAARATRADASLESEASRGQQFDAAMRRAESALAAGDPARAAELFEQASRLAGDSAAAEVGMVRAYMHNGEFRKALSYGNLATLEHRDSTFAYAFLAYLVDRGGQTERALAGLREARASAPDDVALLGAESQIRIERGEASVALGELEAWRARNGAQEDIERLYAQALHHAGRGSISGSPPATGAGTHPSPSRAGPTLAAAEALWSRRWPAPYQPALALASGSRFETASGALIDGGRRVATVGSILRDATRIMVRTSRGALRAARIESVSSETGVAVLRLDEPIAEIGGDDAPATAAPVPGSPCYVVGYLQKESADPTWPVLSAGLHGRWQAQPGGVSATIGVTPGQFGAPALDRYGRLIGIVMPAPSADGASSSRAAVIHPLAGAVPREGSSADAPQPAPQQEIYERGFALAALVVVVRD